MFAVHETKCKLIGTHGTKCMLCKRNVELFELQWHHIKPKYASKREGREPDNSYENGSLLCASCHHMIHQYDYDDIRYKALTAIIMHNKKNPSS